MVLPATQLISKSAKVLGTRLTSTKIKNNVDRPTLLAGSSDGKQTIFQVQPYQKKIINFSKFFIEKYKTYRINDTLFLLQLCKRIFYKM